MRSMVLGGALVLLAACAGGDREPAADTTAAGMEPAPSPMAAASLAGRWNMETRAAGGTDTVVTRYVLTATGDTTGWSMQFVGRDDVIPVRVVMMEGDSVVTEAGPYGSARRPGMQVSTRASWRMMGDRLTGTTRATYTTASGDSVVTFQSEGTRAP